MGILFRDSGRPAYGKVLSKNLSGLAGDKILLDAPGEGKEIVILAINSTTNCSLGTAALGSATFYYVRSGIASFAIGFGIGENKQVSTNASSGYMSITYYIHTL